MSIGMERSQIWPRNKGENSELNTSRKYNSEAFVRFCHLFAFISQYLRYSTSISLTIKHSWNIFALRELLFLVSETRVRGSISRRGRGGARRGSYVLWTWRYWPTHSCCKNSSHFPLRFLPQWYRNIHWVAEFTPATSIHSTKERITTHICFICIIIFVIGFEKR